ncbi:MAG TPA: Holliday junction branch migration protein RuvA [Tepidisphaeraceae bacterium]|jgi:Holliday junction DNA helicase RuvA
MISAITGQVAHVYEASLDLRVGPMLMNILVPASDLPEIETLVGRETTFHTLLYLEGDPNRGNLEPRMIGFLNRQDRAFFELFTTVKGIGPKTALRALTEPISAVAHAVESKNARFLTGLKGIGKRTAELIVAELSGKLGAFAVAPADGRPASAGLVSSKLNSAEEDAVLTLVTLGERRPDAEALLEKAKAAGVTTTDQLVREMLRLRGGR